MERREEDHSSFERPATITFPFTKEIWVMVSMRGFWQPVVAEGASARLTDSCLALSSDTLVIFPLASTRTINGWASGPLPRDAERYTFFEMGFTFMSLTTI